MVLGPAPAIAFLAFSAGDAVVLVVYAVAVAKTVATCCNWSMLCSLGTLLAYDSLYMMLFDYFVQLNYYAST